jgi:hypothetical protein
LGDMRAASGSGVAGAANYARSAPCFPHRVIGICPVCAQHRVPVVVAVARVQSCR